MKKGTKRKHSDAQVGDSTPGTDPLAKKHAGKKWINRQRVLVLSSRGIGHRDRHLMEDIKKLMPHHKPESKMERSKTLSVINEMCEMKNCNKALLFEGRRMRDLYLWMSNVPNGPSVKFLVENVHTMAELKLTGNCLRGSRPLLSFDPTFKEKPHYQILKELIKQIFGVPKHHPKSQPFFDHVYTFSILDDRIWFRNFQILSEDGALSEIGPRMVLNPVKIFSGSFGGIALWENPKYTSPAKYRRQLLLAAKSKAYIDRKHQKLHAEASKPDISYKLNPLDDIFKEDPLEENGADDNGTVQVDTVTAKQKKKNKVSHKIKKSKKLVKRKQV